MEYLQS